MRRWRWLLFLIVLAALTWQAWTVFNHWRNTIRITFPDGSRASNATVSIWFSGNSAALNPSRRGLDFGPSFWPSRADSEGIYRLNRSITSSRRGVTITATGWKDGREHQARVEFESTKSAGWPVRLTLNPIR